MVANPYAPQRGERTVVKVPGLARIRHWRVLTQIDLAELTGLQQSTISRLEHGGEAEARTVRTLARALGVSVYDLTETSPDRPPAPEPEG